MSGADARRPWRACVAAALAFISVFWAGLSARAEPFRTPRIETELFSARAEIAPGDRFSIGLRQTMAPGWHTYWINPGDTGLATTLEWTAPPGARLGPLQFPAPQRLPFETLMNFGYAGEVIYPIDVEAPQNLRPGQTFTLAAHARWLICSDVCVPEEGVLRLSIPVAAAPRDDPGGVRRLAAARARLPLAAPIEARYTTAETFIWLSMGGPALRSTRGSLRNPAFFPFAQGRIAHAAPQRASFGADGLSLALAPPPEGVAASGPLEGVLTAERRVDGEWRPWAVVVRAAEGPPVPGAGRRPGPAAGVPSLPIAALFAFLGGLLLNLMPCVFPVLSLKALALARAHGGDGRRGGLMFALGVLAAFAILALSLAILRASGAALGWGFQLQSPFLVAGLAVLFFAIGLNLLGAFSVGGAFQGWGGRWTRLGGDAGSFFTGALAVVAATPCTAPFMGAAVAAALSGGPLELALIFLCLGLGFAAPIVVLSATPGLARLLPRPGPWMERLRALLAFPMFAASAWLAWVLASQAGPGAVAALAGLCIAFGFAVVAAPWGRWGTAAAILVLLSAVALAWGPLKSVAPAAASSTPAQAWSAERVTALRAAGRPVFVDFTAAWCVTCQVNTRVALDTPRTRAAFAAAGVVYLVADWTRPNEAIAAELAAHGAEGVPLYLYYAPGAQQPTRLPQILTEAIVLRAIGAGR